MPTLQVRDLPEDVYRRLLDRAEAEHRSLAQETIVILRQALTNQQTPRIRRKRVLDSLQTLQIGSTFSFPNPEDLIREDRDR